jgi:hypothetical protein
MLRIYVPYNTRHKHHKKNILSHKSFVISKIVKFKFEIVAIVLRKWGIHQNNSAQKDESNGGVEGNGGLPSLLNEL